MPCEVIWFRRSWSTVVQVMACCLMAPSHHLSQYWLTITDKFRHSFQYNAYLTLKISISMLYLKLIHSKITATFPRERRLKVWTRMGQCTRMDKLSRIRTASDCRYHGQVRYKKYVFINSNSLRLPFCVKVNSPFINTSIRSDACMRQLITSLVILLPVRSQAITCTGDSLSLRVTWYLEINFDGNVCECVYMWDTIFHNMALTGLYGLNLLCHIEAETKWPPFCRRPFHLHFLERIYMNFD